MEFVGEVFVIVAEARIGAVVSSVTELVSTRVLTFAASSLSQIESTFAFWVAVTAKVEGRVPTV